MALTIASFLLITALVGVLSWRATRRDDHQSATGYFLAGRSLTWIVVAGSLLLTNLSTEQLVGLNGGGYQHGMMVMAWEIWAALAMVLMALVFLPRYLRGGVTTVPQFFENRYGKSVRLVTSLLFLLALLTNLLPFVLYSGAVAMNGLFGVEEMLQGVERFGWSPRQTAIWVLVISLGVVGSLYAILGGLKAVAVSDTINGAALLVGGLMIPVLGLWKLGEGSLTAGIRDLMESAPAKLDPVGGPGDNIPFSTLFTGMLLVHCYYWCTNQTIVQRTFGARSLEQGQKGVLFAALMKLGGPLYLVLPGLIAWRLFGDSLADRPDDAYPMLVKTVLPGPLTGFFGAAIFGAILSSFNSGLNSAATLFSMDLYRGVIRPGASDAQTVRAGKIFGLCIAVGAVLAAPFIALAGGGLFELMKNLSALYDIPLLALLVLGIVLPRAPSAAALAAVGFGLVFYLVFGFVLDNHIFGKEFHWLHVAGINFALICSVVVVITWLHPRKEPYVQKDVGAVELRSWRWAVPVSVAVAVLATVIYVSLWWVGRG